MGVYIPNETMPEECYTCFCYETEFNMCSLTGKRLDDIRIRQDDCPLEEIDLVKCKDCKRCEERTTANGLPFLYCLKMEVSVGSDQYCYWGERRNDE